MHTPGTKIWKVGTPKSNRLQVRYTLEVLSDFVQWSNIDPVDIVIIAPYKPNVLFGKLNLKATLLERFPTLDGIMPIQTAYCSRGREGKMAVVIFGTTKKSSKPVNLQ